MDLDYFCRCARMIPGATEVTAAPLIECLQIRDDVARMRAPHDQKNALAIFETVQLAVAATATERGRHPRPDRQRVAREVDFLELDAVALAGAPDSVDRHLRSDRGHDWPRASSQTAVAAAATELKVP